MVAETPGVTLAFVGDGPSRPGLEEHFRGLPVTFMVRAASMMRNKNLGVIDSCVHMGLEEHFRGLPVTFMVRAAGRAGA